MSHYGRSIKALAQKLAGFGLPIAMSLFFVSVSAQTPTVRVISALPGVALDTRLLSGDEVVIVEEIAHVDGIEFTEETSKRNWIGFLSVFSDIVVVMDVESIQGLLTKDRSWIRTRLTGVVRDVLISRATFTDNRPAERLVDGIRLVRRVTSGERLEVDHGAGELTINGVFVKTMKESFGPSGRQYLVTMKIHPENGTLYLSSIPHLIDNGALVAEGMLPGDRVLNPLNGASLEEVAREFRALEPLEALRSPRP